MGGDDLRDRAVAAALDGPQDRGGGIYRYQRYGITLDGGRFERDAVRVGKVVVIVPVDLARDCVVLIREFRLGAQLAIGCGEMIELPAGRVESGEALATAAGRECREEIGVSPSRLAPVFDVMPSPGMSDEHMTFFLAAVDASVLPERAGAAHEKEDTRPVSVSIDRALAALEAGGIRYGAAVLGLQWLALHRSRLSEILDASAP